MADEVHGLVPSQVLQCETMLPASRSSLRALANRVGYACQNQRASAHKAAASAGCSIKSRMAAIVGSSPPLHTMMCRNGTHQHVLARGTCLLPWVASIAKC